MRLFDPNRSEPSADAGAPSRGADRRVGVVIPVYNRRTILLETLPFVVEQTHAPAQLVVVDDGSTDGTAAAVDAWLSKRRPPCSWEVIRLRHSTAAHARNVGLEQVQSLPFVAFLDSDDHWPGDFLARGVATLGENPYAAAAVADRRFIDAFGECVDEDDCRDLVKRPVEWFFQNGAGVASCSVLRTDAVLAAGSWDTNYDSAEDAVLFCAMSTAGEWVHIPGEPVEFHLGSARARREEHNLSQRQSDSHLCWAKTFEEIFDKIRAQSPGAPLGQLHKPLAMRWYWAGKQLFALGRADEARECFRRAITWQPMMFRAWRRLATSGVVPWGRADKSSASHGAKHSRAS